MLGWLVGRVGSFKHGGLSTNKIFKVVESKIVVSDLTNEALDINNLLEPKRLAVYGDYLYLVDGQSEELKRVLKNRGQSQELVLGKMKDLSDVIVVDKHSFDSKFVCLLPADSVL